MDKNRHPLGYSLVETIVMIAILAVVGVILTDTVTQIFRGQNKSAILNQVKQNGQTALNQVAGVIKNADRVVCLPSSGDRIVLSSQGAYTRIMFYPTTSSDSPYIGLDNPDPLSTTDACSQPAGTVSKLTDSDPVTGLSVTGSFSRVPSAAGVKDVVVTTIYVNVGTQAKQTPENLVNNAGIKFETATQLK